MIKAVIFDVGGVVYSVDSTVWRQKMAEYFDVPLGDFHKELNIQLQKFESGAITETEVYENIGKKFDKGKALPQQSLFLQQWKDRVAPKQEVVELIKRLKEKGYTIAALSNTNTAHADWHKEHSEYSMFPNVFLSYEIGLIKPDPAIYKYVLEKLQVRPQETVFIDDLKENVEGSVKLGIHSILFRGVEDLRGNLKKLGVDL